jgi:hypothetical protein
MSKFGLDYSELEGKITKKAFRLADVKDQLEVVAFDIVRFRDTDKGADLWQVQSADDGDYIVALYEEDDSAIEKKASAKSCWGVIATKTGGDLQISYKGDPIVRLSSAQLGIPSNELHLAEHYLPERLASNKQLVKALLSELNEVARLEVAKRYPELV